MRYTFSPLIKRDLDEIAAWIAKDSPRLALKVIRQLRAELRAIAQQPLIYRLRPEVGADARLAVAGRNVILFRIDGDTVRFERVVYGGRDLPAFFKGQSQLPED